MIILDLLCRYWDLRQQTPAHTQQLPERCYALSVRHPLMVVATADRNIVVYNLQSPQVSTWILAWIWIVVKRGRFLLVVLTSPHYLQDRPTLRNYSCCNYWFCWHSYLPCNLMCHCAETDRVQADSISIEVSNSMRRNFSRKGRLPCKSTST